MFFYYPQNSCKVMPAKQPEFVLVRFSNDSNCNHKMKVIERLPDGGYVLQHTAVYKTKDLYKVAPGESWTTYEIVTNK